jgi:phage gpG-like protein
MAQEVTTGAELQKAVEKQIEQELKTIETAAKAYEDFTFGYAIEIPPLIPTGRVDLEWKSNEILGGLEQELEQEIEKEIQKVLPNYLDREITSVGAVDTGKLKGSASVRIVNGEILVNYDVDYALFVHEGGYVTPYGNPNAQKVFVPGRPWVQQAFDKLPMEQIIQAAMTRVLG